jgi:peptidoglycan/xylan/chitin deacetylase (PgdA/CDA1 family)
MTPIVLKIDVDTHEGMKHGVPRLLDILNRHGVPGTFFLTFGPDRMGLALLQLRKPRFLQKMIQTGAPSLYGWRTVFSGTLLPARPVATAFPGTVRRLLDEGHEAAVHAWDHRAWQDNLDRFKSARIRRVYERSCAAFRTLTGTDPQGVGAPAWTTTPNSLHIQDGFPFTYASDLRGGPHCRLITAAGPLRLPQFTGTGACLEELIPRHPADEALLAQALLAEVLAGHPPLRVLTLHAEVEGGPYAGVLDRLLPRLKERGPVVTMASVCPALGPTLPERVWRRVSLPGRAFPVTSSAPLREGRL